MLGTAQRLVALATVAGAMCMPAPALASAPPTPWNGANPFHCRMQNAGQGTHVRHPGADPYCVRFDKTHQNVTQLGLVSFLLLEPARVAAAAPKCFYFQEDHWRGSIVQGNGSTELYNFEGHYFFNKATGDGGVWVNHFSIAHRTFDPRTLPGFPPQWDSDFGPGKGGVVTHDNFAADPACRAKRGSATPSTGGSGLGLGLFGLGTL